MNVLYLLVPAALILAALGALAFAWAVRSGQFEDVQTPAIRVLLDDEQSSPAKPAPPLTSPESNLTDDG